MTAPSVARPVLLDADTTREMLAETLALLNADAKAISRRGYVGTASAEYGVKHGQIDAVLSDLLAARA